MRNFLVPKRNKEILEFDIVIVGAGSAGSVIAGRLADQTNIKILVLESGGSDFRPDIKAPIGYGMTFFNSNVNWCYSSVPQEKLFNRELYVPRGKVVGGSGSINAMVYLHGLRNDFDDWESFGGDQLSWESVKESYGSIEGVGSNSKKRRIHVSDVSDQHEKILENFFAAGEKLGFNYSSNLNEPNLGELGSYPLNTKNGVRWTSADGFLRPAIKSNNIELIKNATATRLQTENGKVTGLEFFKGKDKKLVKVTRGVILAAGAVNTPKLLLLSGIGPGNELIAHGIEVIHSEPNIGKNLQDHLGIDYLYETSANSLNKVLGTWMGRIRSALTYLLFRKGPFSLSVNQGGGFVNWNSRNKAPNLQLYFNPITYSIKRNSKKRELLKTDKFNGFAIGFQPCRPNSRGEVTLFSKHVFDPPRIDPKFLSDDSDMHDVVAGINCIESFLKTKDLSDIIVKEKSLNLNISGLEEKIDDFKNRAVSIYHLCGTCRMGKDPIKAPVANNFKLRGFENLWVADASLFPNVTSGNINSPTMMLAYKASDAIVKQI